MTSGFYERQIKATKTPNRVKVAFNLRRTRLNVIAFLCFAGGIFFGTIGLFLDGVAYLVGGSGVGFQVGTILVFTTLPLMVLGAHALDKLEEVK